MCPADLCSHQTQQLCGAARQKSHQEISAICCVFQQNMCWPCSSRLVFVVPLVHRGFERQTRKWLKGHMPSFNCDSCAQGCDSKSTTAEYEKLPRNLSYRVELVEHTWKPDFKQLAPCPTKLPTLWARNPGFGTCASCTWILQDGRRTLTSKVYHDSVSQVPLHHSRVSGSWQHSDEF